MRTNRLRINTIRVSIESCLAHRNERARESRKAQKKTFKFAFARSDTWHDFHLQCLALIGLKKGNTRSISLFSLDQITALGVPCHSVTGSIWRIELTSQKVLRFKENMKSLYLMEQKKAGAGSMPCSHELYSSNHALTNLHGWSSTSTSRKQIRAKINNHRRNVA